MTERRDRVIVTGPDTWTFLQSLVSQDLDGLADGERRMTLLLTPRGKVEILAGVVRSGETAIFDTDPGWGAALAAALARYQIRTKVDIAVEPASAVDESVRDAEEAERIAAGRPRMGTELDETVIPQEAFLERDAVSFTKGCFVGQELVCRIDTRGHVNRYLRQVIPSDPAVTVAPGCDIVVDGQTVGTVTSSTRGAALGYVRREVEMPATALIGAEHAVVRSIPA